MEHGPVVPDVEHPHVFDGGHVSDDPLDPIRLRAEAFRRCVECTPGDVQDRDVAETQLQGFVDEHRGSGANVEEGPCPTVDRFANAPDRDRRRALVPADLARRPTLVDPVPMLAPVHGGQSRTLFIPVQKEGCLGARQDQVDRRESNASVTA